MDITRLRIAHVGDEYTHYSIPLLKRLSTKYDVSVLFHSISKTVDRIPKEVVYRKLTSFYWKRKNLWFPIALPFCLIRGKFHLFIASDPNSLTGLLSFLLSKTLRKLMVIKDEHWYWPKTLLHSLIWPFSLLVIRHVDLIVVPGKRVKTFYEKMGISNKKLMMIPFDVSVIEFQKDHIAEAERIRNELNLVTKTVVLYLGRLVKKKGVEYLIRAFNEVLKECRDAALVIVGEGEERNKLETLCKQLSTRNVHFVGFVDESRKPAYFVLADIFVYPSITEKSPEPWGLAVNEAMSAGKPVVVTTAVGCAYDLVKHGVNGYIVPEKDERSLYNVITHLIKNKKLRENMGKESRKIIVSNFTLARQVEGFERAILAVSKRFCTQE